MALRATFGCLTFSSVVSAASLAKMETSKSERLENLHARRESILRELETLNGVERDAPQCDALCSEMKACGAYEEGYHRECLFYRSAHTGDELQRDTTCMVKQADKHGVVAGYDRTLGHCVDPEAGASLLMVDSTSVSQVQWPGFLKALSGSKDTDTDLAVKGENNTAEELCSHFCAEMPKCGAFQYVVAGHCFLYRDAHMGDNTSTAETCFVKLGAVGAGFHAEQGRCVGADGYARLLVDASLLAHKTEIQ